MNLEAASPPPPPLPCPLMLCFAGLSVAGISILPLLISPPTVGVKASNRGIENQPDDLEPTRHLVCFCHMLTVLLWRGFTTAARLPSFRIPPPLLATCHIVVGTMGIVSR